MRVLITGATGFVGAHATAVAVAAGHDVVALHHGPGDGRLLAAIARNSSALASFVQADVCDATAIDRIVRDYAPTHMLHAAAITPSPAQETGEPRRVVATNELGTLNLLVAAARHSVQRFVLVSSTGVYTGLDGSRELDEESPLCDPCGLYAVTKLGAERLSRWARQTLQLDASIVRLGSVYGQFERPTPSRSRMSWIYQAISLGHSGTEVRCNAPDAKRDWIHGDDVGAALMAVLQARNLPHVVYNLAGPRQSIAAVVGELSQIMPTLRIEWVQSLEEANLAIPPSAHRCSISAVRLRRDVGFAPTIDLAFGLRLCVADFGRWGSAGLPDPGADSERNDGDGDGDIRGIQST